MQQLDELIHNRTALFILAGILAAFLYMVFAPAPKALVMSGWSGVQGVAEADPEPQPIRPTMLVPGQRPSGTPNTPGSIMLEGYNSKSTLIDSAANGRIRLFRRNLPAGGEIAYVVVLLDQQTHIEVINADGATPGSDATGDTIWRDGGRHRRTVEEMAQASYSQRDGKTLIGAMAFGFHGEARTSNEGTVVINNTVLRVNPGRSTLCIKPDGTTEIGILNAEQAAQCAQAVGAGPVVMLNGKLANPQMQRETNDFVPFNPLGEDFVQLDWRRTVFSGSYPKTMVGIGVHEDGRHYLVLVASYGSDGLQVVRQLRAMGCTHAIGGDDDSSTQLVWRGTQVVQRPVRQVPDAIAFYAVP